MYEQKKCVSILCFHGFILKVYLKVGRLGTTMHFPVDSCV